MVMCGRRGFHRQTHRPASDDIVVAGPRARTQASARAGYKALFAALSMGILELEEFYTKLDFRLVSEARFFPHVTSFDARTGHTVQFSYEEYADPIPSRDKAVFIANTRENQKIVVKFTEVYNDIAHSLLAAKGLAPPLFSCDRTTFSDFTMVVMGYVDGKQLFHKYPDVTPGVVLDKISDALKTLHESHLVFGDLRSPNILVTDQGKVQLVDFDWCGKVGEGKYPADINREDIKWPEGVVPGGFLRFEHDDEMFRILKLGGSRTTFSPGSGGVVRGGAATGGM